MNVGMTLSHRWMDSQWSKWKRRVVTWHTSSSTRGTTYLQFHLCRFGLMAVIWNIPMGKWGILRFKYWAFCASVLGGRIFTPAANVPKLHPHFVQWTWLEAGNSVYKIDIRASLWIYLDESPLGTIPGLTTSETDKGKPWGVSYREISTKGEFAPYFYCSPRNSPWNSVNKSTTLTGSTIAISDYYAVITNTISPLKLLSITVLGTFTTLNPP